MRPAAFLLAVLAAGATFPASPADLGLTLRHLLGPPGGAPAVELPPDAPVDVDLVHEQKGAS